MKHLIAVVIAVLVLWAGSGWAGEVAIEKKWRDGGPAPWEYETHFIVPIHMEDDISFSVGGLKAGMMRVEHWVKGSKPCGGDRCPYQIRTIPADEANEWLKENPGWEPFDVGGGYVNGIEMYQDPNWSGVTAIPQWRGEPETIYLRRRVCEDTP